MFPSCARVAQIALLIGKRKGEFFFFFYHSELRSRSLVCHHRHGVLQGNDLPQWCCAPPAVFIAGEETPGVQHASKAIVFQIMV